MELAYQKHFGQQRHCETLHRNVEAIPPNGTTTFQKNPFPNLVMLIISSRNVFDPP